MNIRDALHAYFDEKDPDVRGELLLRREVWSHGRVIIPGQYDIYVTKIGAYPMMPVPIEFDTQELMADDWQITTRDEMSRPKVVHRPQRTGRRVSVGH